MSHETLAIIWFVLIAVLWCGYFVLEGFDFGVGILLPFIGKNEAERRTVVSTLGPVWDGNEVWLLTAGGATFAAFSLWYATLFSGFYLALLLILVALIIRGVAFEFRSKRGTASSPSWRRNWDIAIFIGSFVPALLWGVAFANIVAGVPLELQNGNSEFTGNLFTLLNPYALLGGLVTLGLFTTHGAVFLALKTDGEIRTRANALAGQIGVVTAVLAVLFGVWTQLSHSNNAVASAVVLALVVIAWVGALAANRMGREGWAFIASAATMVFVVVFLFVCLYPNVMPSSTNPDATLTVQNAANSQYTLTIMTWVAVILTPVVLVYQAWTYWVFRKRLSPSQIPNPEEGSLDLPHEVGTSTTA
ncbi:MAG TPA: cytochrome d ubiquinol oxidase subunit II [Candidatus Nanopelagicales bacterium]|nr:cytochrome d ubiquinol oxidase subunit II [Candidatus Nanopelagicales bacterium]